MNMHLLLPRPVFSCRHCWQAVPGAAGALSSTIDSETRAAVATMFPSELIQSQTLSIPATGRAYSDILAEMAQWRTFDPKRGRVFGYMYESCDPQYEHFIESAFVMYMHENGLNPTAFPALRKLEVEVVAMTLDMFHAPPSAVGTMTSGGTESLLLTIKSYRDRARALHPHITKPEAVMCHSVHVAVPKACAYFDVQPVFIDMDPQTMQADVDKMRAAITNNTILLLASAPQYPHGIVDPVVEIGRLAVERKLPLHVDACMGGFLLPWVEKLGFPVPQFDFRVAGVTSISADIHKYGYAAKGASTLSWISQEYRQYQFFAFAQWPGGMFVSPSMLGTRPGGAIAAAYAALVGNGQSGYLARAKVLMECSKQLQRALAAVPEVRVLGEPHMSIVAWTTKKEFEKEINLFAVADVMVGTEQRDREICLVCVCAFGVGTLCPTFIFLMFLVLSLPSFLSLSFSSFVGLSGEAVQLQGRVPAASGVPARDPHPAAHRPDRFARPGSGRLDRLRARPSRVRARGLGRHLRPGGEDSVRRRRRPIPGGIHG